MPSIRNMARSTGPNAPRTTGAAWSRSASSGWTAWYSVPSSRIVRSLAASPGRADLIQAQAAGHLVNVFSRPGAGRP
jgi:hypothetical protein